MFSCDKEHEAPIFSIEAFASKYMVRSYYRSAYQESAYQHWNIIDPLEAYTLEYVRGKVTKQTGGYNCLLNNVCFNDTIKSNDRQVIYDVNRTGNAVDVTIRSIGEWKWVVQEWHFKMKAENQPDYLIYKQENRQSYDSLKYTYSSDGKLAQIVCFSVFRNQHGTSVNKDAVKNFFFNAEGNLEKVETRLLLNDEKFLTMIIETFEDYDTAINPFQHLFMFDNTFYRSLSKNNFRKFRSQKLDVRSGADTGSYGWNWTLEYNEQGVPLFNKL
ncbi:hypothetical protein GCM10028895_44290 [Pontibacter rugosus]